MSIKISNPKHHLYQDLKEKYQLSVLSIACLCQVTPKQVYHVFINQIKRKKIAEDRMYKLLEHLKKVESEMRTGNA